MSSSQSTSSHDTHNAEQSCQSGVLFLNASNSSTSSGHARQLARSDGVAGSATDLRLDDALESRLQSHQGHSVVVGPGGSASDETQQDLAVLARAGLWSDGTARHAEAKCRPCHYIHSKAGCANGRDCPFCHFPHTDKNRQRLGMAKRMLCKNIVSTLADVCQDDQQHMRRLVKTMSSQSAYLSFIMEERLRSQLGDAGAASSTTLCVAGYAQHRGGVSEEMPAWMSDDSPKKNILTL